MDALNKLNSVWKASKAAILNIPEIEQKVLDTTNNEKWGPTGQQMNEVARATYAYNDFPVIMEVIWRRLAERVPTDWRHVYKTLLLLEYILRNGSDQVITETRVHLYALERLSSYSAYEDGKDSGLSVRERAKAVLELVTDERRLRDERDKAAANRKKFQASISSEDYRGGYGGGGFNGGGGGFGGGGYTSYDDPYGDSGNNSGNNYNQWSQSPSNVQSRNAPPVQSYNNSAIDQFAPHNAPVNNEPPKTTSILGLNNGNEDDDSSSDSDDDFIPKEAAKAASRPRAPSGGSSTTPKVQDLLGISAIASPQATPQVAPQANFNPQFNAQFNQQQQVVQQQQNVQSTPSPSFDFFSPTPQQQQQAVQQQQQQQQVVQQNMLSFGGPSPQTQSSPAPSQVQSPVAPKPATSSPSVPSVDDKDPWKKAANLFNLDSLTDEISKPKEPSVTPQGYNNLRNLQGQPPSFNQMNMNMNMNMNMGRGAPMGNFNQFPGQFGGNPNPQFSQFGGNPNGQFMNPNPQFGGNPNGQFMNPNPQFNQFGNNNQFAMQNNMMGMNNMNNMNMNAGRGGNPNNTFW